MTGFPIPIVFWTMPHLPCSRVGKPPLESPCQYGQAFGGLSLHGCSKGSRRGRAPYTAMSVVGAALVLGMFVC